MNNQLMDSLHVLSLKDIVPQADDVKKIVKIPALVSTGINTKQKVADHYSFDKRQGGYYTEAAEAFGFIIRHDQKLFLTPWGMLMIQYQGEIANAHVSASIIRIPIIQEIIVKVYDSGFDGLCKDDIVALIAAKTGYGATTLLRRTKTIFSYLEWLSNNRELIIIRNGRIFIRR